MSGIATLAQALAQIERIKDQQTMMNNYSTQLATGKKTQQYTGLGADVLTTQRARTDIQTLKTYQANITNASRRIDLTLGAVQEFKQQAKNFLGFLQGLSQENAHQKGDIIYYDDPTTTTVEEIPVAMSSGDMDADMKNLTDFAKKIFSTFEDLLNAKDGDRYLLGGAETRDKPFTSNGILDSAVTSMISSWKSGTLSTSDLIDNLKDRSATTNPGALTDTIIGYSSNLSSGNVGNVYVRVGESYQVDYTVKANEQPFRDIMVAISYFKNENLTPVADVYLPPNVPAPMSTPDIQGAPGATLDDQKGNFFQVLNSIAGSVSNAMKDIDNIIGRLSQAQARLDEIETTQTNQSNLLKSVVSDIEDIDQNEVALKLSTLATQLEISYSVTARVQQLSLANYLPLR